jgi:DNA-binding transcriptional ArsR family regulator
MTITLRRHGAWVFADLVQLSAVCGCMGHTIAGAGVDRLRAVGGRSIRLSTPRAEYIARCIVPSVDVIAHGEVLARFGQALSDPTRARVLLALREAPSYPAELADLLAVSRQSLSNHLACLRGCGLVVAVPEGRRVRYELTDPRLALALADLLGVVLVSDPQLCPAAEDGCC